ncbi:hypothetical protein T492DRAFT_912265, partial [Pavlovales sp. CCMP2436]
MSGVDELVRQALALAGRPIPLPSQLRAAQPPMIRNEQHAARQSRVDVASARELAVARAHAERELEQCAAAWSRWSGVTELRLRATWRGRAPAECAWLAARGLEALQARVKSRTLSGWRSLTRRRSMRLTVHALAARLFQQRLGRLVLSAWLSIARTASMEGVKRTIIKKGIQRSKRLFLHSWQAAALRAHTKARGFLRLSSSAAALRLRSGAREAAYSAALGAFEMLRSSAAAASSRITAANSAQASKRSKISSALRYWRAGVVSAHFEKGRGRARSFKRARVSSLKKGLRALQSLSLLARLVAVATSAGISRSHLSALRAFKIAARSAAAWWLRPALRRVVVGVARARANGELLTRASPAGARSVLKRKALATVLWAMASSARRGRFSLAKNSRVLLYTRALRVWAIYTRSRLSRFTAGQSAKSAVAAVTRISVITAWKQSSQAMRHFHSAAASRSLGHWSTLSHLNARLQRTTRRASAILNSRWVHTQRLASREIAWNLFALGRARAILKSWRGVCGVAARYRRLLDERTDSGRGQWAQQTFNADSQRGQSAQRTVGADSQRRQWAQQTVSVDSQLGQWAQLAAAAVPVSPASVSAARAAPVSAAARASSVSAASVSASRAAAADAVRATKLAKAGRETTTKAGWETTTKAGRKTATKAGWETAAFAQAYMHSYVPMVLDHLTLVETDKGMESEGREADEEMVCETEVEAASLARAARAVAILSAELVFAAGFLDGGDAQLGTEAGFLDGGDTQPGTGAGYRTQAGFGQQAVDSQRGQSARGWMDVGWRDGSKVGLEAAAVAAAAAAATAAAIAARTVRSDASVGAGGGVGKSGLRLSPCEGVGGRAARHAQTDISAGADMGAGVGVGVTFAAARTEHAALRPDVGLGASLAAARQRTEAAAARWANHLGDVSRRAPLVPPALAQPQQQQQQQPQLQSQPQPQPPQQQQSQQPPQSLQQQPQPRHWSSPQPSMRTAGPVQPSPLRHATAAAATAALGGVRWPRMARRGEHARQHREASPLPLPRHSPDPPTDAAAAAA